MEEWSGALVCPDDSGTFYAVGIFHSKAGNCGFANSEKAPVK